MQNLLNLNLRVQKKDTSAITMSGASRSESKNIGNDIFGIDLTQNKVYI